jgi:RNA polymerase sigma-70 factor (ECF subfamily)
LELRDEQTFEKLFTDWFGKLHTYASSILKDEDIAEESVQAVFTRLWVKRNELHIHTSIKAYLYGCVYRECMDLLRHEKQKKAYRSFVLSSASDVIGARDTVKKELDELEQQINQIISNMPELRMSIFQLSRFGELKYREIAEQLGISVKTVESQMTKAFKELKKNLIGFIE